MAMMIKNVNEILASIMSDLFDLTSPEKRVLSCEARAREWPKICAIVEIDPITLKPIQERAA